MVGKHNYSYITHKLEFLSFFMAASQMWREGKREEKTIFIYKQKNVILESIFQTSLHVYLKKQAYSWNCLTWRTCVLLFLRPNLADSKRWESGWWRTNTLDILAKKLVRVIMCRLLLWLSQLLRHPTGGSPLCNVPPGHGCNYWLCTWDKLFISPWILRQLTSMHIPLIGYVVHCLVAPLRAEIASLSYLISTYHG